MTSTVPAPTQAQIEEFLGKFVTDTGAAVAGATVILGDRLGLYRAVAARQPAIPAEVAAESGLDERYVTEWLRGQAAGGYVAYDASAGTFALTPAQSACLADPDRG